MDIKILKDKRLALIMLSSFIWGVIAHGQTLFNKYAYHDDALFVNGFNDIDTYGLGRWGRAVLGEIALKLFGGLHASTPVFLGVITISCVAAILYIICYRLGIDNPIMIVALSGVTVCFPAITGIFGFFFVSAYFYFGALLGVVGIYIWYSKKSIITFIVCTLLLACSTGLYQANIPIDLMVMLLFMLDEVIGSDMKWKDYFILAAKNALICVTFMAEYLVFNTVALKLKDMELSDYKGVSSFGAAGPMEYVIRIFTAYKRFVKPADFIGPQGVSANMFPWSLKYYHIILIVVSLVLIAVYLRTLKDMAAVIRVGLIVVISPLFAYFIYVMVGETDTHGLMTFGEAFMFLVPAYFIMLLKKSSDVSFEKLTRILSGAAVILMMTIAIVMARYDNVCYLKAEFLQAEAVNYYNRLITRMEMTKGFNEDMPVIYLNDRDKNDDDFSGEKVFEPIYLPPYHRNSIINDYSWKETMELWCGFSHPEGEISELKHIEETENMPSYPEEGSIKIIDGNLVVKF